MVGNYSMIREIKEYAKQNNIPIIEKSSSEILIKTVKEKNPKNILEIGTAIGYSAIMMALVDPNVKITSIERDEKRYLEALKNVKAFDLEDRITEKPARLTGRLFFFMQIGFIYSRKFF